MKKLCKLMKFHAVLLIFLKFDTNNRRISRIINQTTKFCGGKKIDGKALVFAI